MEIGINFLTRDCLCLVGSPVKTYSSPSSNKYSSPMSFDSGLNRGASYSSASSPNRFSSTLNNDASDRLNQIRSRLSLGSSGKIFFFFFSFISFLNAFFLFFSFLCLGSSEKIKPIA